MEDDDLDIGRYYHQTTVALAHGDFPRALAEFEQWRQQILELLGEDFDFESEMLHVRLMILNEKYEQAYQRVERVYEKFSAAADVNSQTFTQLAQMLRIKEYLSKKLVYDLSSVQSQQKKVQKVLDILSDRFLSFSPS